MKKQFGAGAVLLVGVLSGSGFAITLTAPHQQQSQQDNSGQQNKDNKKKKSDQQNSSNPMQNQTATPPPNNQPPSSGSTPGGDKPTPLFGGTIGLKSSRQTKDSATLGFNGVDPNGQVQKAMLSGAATPADALKAQQLAQITIAPADLVQFIQDGGLNPDAAPQKP